MNHLATSSGGTADTASTLETIYMTCEVVFVVHGIKSGINT